MPLSWLSCSPDLTTPDKTLWVIINRQAALHCYCNSDDCAVEQVFTTITPQMLWHMSDRTWQCIRLCFKHDSAHADPLDVRRLLPHGKLRRGTVASWPLCICRGYVIFGQFEYLIIYRHVIHTWMKHLLNQWMFFQVTRHF
jgi:hypothetical protein